MFLFVNDEAKATALARFPVFNHGREDNPSERFKSFAQGGGFRPERKVANEEFVTLGRTGEEGEKRGEGKRCQRERCIQVVRFM